MNAAGQLGLGDDQNRGDNAGEIVALRPIDLGTGRSAVAASVGFFHGAMLVDPAGLLEGAGKRMRHVKLRPGNDVNLTALDALILIAYRDIRQRLA